MKRGRWLIRLKEIMNFPFWKKIGRVAFILNLTVISYVIILDIVKQPLQKGILDSLKTEFNKIDKLPTASIVDERYTCFSGKTSVNVTYWTAAPDSEVQKFYNEELLKNGWELTTREKVYDWGRDLGGQTLIYSKSNIVLVMDFSGARSQYGWAYGVYLKMKE